MIAGLYILSMLIIFLFNKKYNLFTQLLISSVVSVILYIPWIPEIITQFSSQYVGKHLNIFSFVSIKYIIMKYALITLLVIVIIFIKKTKLDYDVKIILFINILVMLLILLFNAKFNPYSISVRYVSIALIMNYVITGNILIYNFNKGWIVKILFLIFAITLFNSNTRIFDYQIKTMIVPSIHFYREFNFIKHDKNNTITSEKYSLDKYPWNLQGGNSVYFNSINKRVYYNKPLDIYDSVGNGNKKLFRNIYPGVNSYVDKLR